MSVPRSSRGRFGRKVDPEQAEKIRQAIELRIAGRTWAEIAKVLGFAGKSGAFKLVDNALRDLIREPAEQLRKIEFARLEKMHGALWPRALRGELAVIDRLVRIADRRAKLLGLDISSETNLTPMVPPKIVIQYADADPVQSPAVGNAPSAAAGDHDRDAVGPGRR